MLVIKESIKEFLEAIYENAQLAFLTNNEINELKKCAGGLEIYDYINNVQNALLKKIQLILTDEKVFQNSTPITNSLVAQTIDEYENSRQQYYKYIKNKINELKEEDKENNIVVPFVEKNEDDKNFEAVCTDYIDKKIIITLFNINANNKLNEIEHLFTMTSSVISSLRERQIELTSSTKAPLFDPSLYSKIRNHSKILINSCKQNKVWINFDNSKVNNINYPSEAANQPTQIENDEKGYYEDELSQYDGTTSELYQNIHLVNTNEWISDKLYSANRINIDENNLKMNEREEKNSNEKIYNKNLSGKLTIQTTKEAEEAILFNFYIKNSNTKRISKPNKLIDVDDNNGNGTLVNCLEQVNEV